MKKLLTIPTLLLALSTLFMACQKETQTENKAPASSLTNDLGSNEFLLRTSGGSAVIYSGWIKKIQADWTGIGTHEINTMLTAPSLSDAIKNTGVVLVYYMADGKVHPLPLTWFDDVYKETLDYTFEKQKINLTLRLFGNVIQGIVDLDFRYVLIPGTQGAGKMMSPQVDYNNYDAVCEYYGIPK